MPIKAVIVITDEKGQLFEGTAELLPKDGSTKRKGTLLSRKLKLRKVAAKLLDWSNLFRKVSLINRQDELSMRIREKLRAKVISLRNTQLQPYLAQMVKNDELERNQNIRDNRKVFLYSKN